MNSKFLKQVFQDIQSLHVDNTELEFSKESTQKRKKKETCHLDILKITVIYLMKYLFF